MEKLWWDKRKGVERFVNGFKQLGGEHIEKIKMGG